MTDPSIARPFGKAHLGDESRLDPVMSAPAWRAARERRGRTRDRPELGADRLERALVESGAHLGDVDELGPVVQSQMQGTEVRPRALRHRVAADDEFLTELALDLQPVARALRGIRAVALFRDDTLEALLAGSGQKVRAVLEHVVAEVDDAARRHQESQALLARLERQPPQVTAVEPERVEEDGADGHLAPGALDVRRARETHALLEPLEARAPALVEGDDLAVEDEALEWERVQRRRHLRIARGEELPAPSAQLDLVARARSENPHAVVLDLEQPRRIRRRLVDERRQHHEIAARRDLAARRPQLGQPAAYGRDPARAVAQLLDRQAREHGLGIAFRRLHVADVFVGLLEQEPVAILAAHPRERPPALQLEAEQLELELAARDLLAGGLRLQQLESPGVPDDRRTGSVAAFGNDAFEVGVLDRVVLDVHGQALFVGAHRRPLGHGPALEHAVDLEAQIVVEPARRVLVDDEPVAAGLAGSPEGLGRRGGIALAPVFVQIAASHGAPG